MFWIISLKILPNLIKSFQILFQISLIFNEVLTLKHLETNR